MRDEEKKHVSNRIEFIGFISIDIWSYCTFFLFYFFFSDDGEDYVDITEPEEDYERVIKLEKKKKPKTS